jgi:hypothetical protein
VTVGYLSRGDAARYRDVLSSMTARGQLPTAEARVCRAMGGPLAAFLHVNDPEGCVLVNAMPVGAAAIPPERQCAVTGETRHQEALKFWEPRAGETRHVWATLHPATVPSGSRGGEFTSEVRIDGQRVGTLTAAQGQRNRQLVAARRAPACEASVYHGGKGLEVRLYLPKVD